MKGSTFTAAWYQNKEADTYEDTDHLFVRLSKGELCQAYCIKTVSDGSPVTAVHSMVEAITDGVQLNAASSLAASLISVAASVFLF